MPHVDLDERKAIIVMDQFTSIIVGIEIYGERFIEKLNEELKIFDPEYKDVVLAFVNKVRQISREG